MIVDAFHGMFPKLQSSRGRLSRNIGRWLNRPLDKHGSDRPELTYHSLRHVFADDLRNKAPVARLPDAVINSLVGHAGGKTGEEYGFSHRLNSHQRAVNPFGIEGLDLSRRRPGSAV